MRRLIFSIFLLVMLAALWIATTAPAHAGAWPREKGRGFLATATRAGFTDPAGPYAIYSTGYLEYGLGRGYTIGLDIGHAISGRSKAVLFLRLPPFEPVPGHLLALEIGAGRIAGEQTLRPGLSYGHAIHGRRPGWFSIEGVFEYRPASARRDFKADITLGINHGNRLKTILQVQTGVSTGDPSFIRLAPSVVYRVSAKSHIEIGATAGLRGDSEYGLKLGFWREF